MRYIFFNQSSCSLWLMVWNDASNWRTWVFLYCPRAVSSIWVSQDLRRRSFCSSSCIHFLYADGCLLFSLISFHFLFFSESLPCFDLWMPCQSKSVYSWLLLYWSIDIPFSVTCSKTFRAYVSWNSIYFWSHFSFSSFSSSFFLLFVSAALNTS